MPVLDITLERLSELLGRRIDVDTLDEILFQMGMELASVNVTENGTELKIEITPDRPDMLISFGFARALKKYMGLDSNIDKIKTKKSEEYKLIVDKSVSKIRPFIGAMVVKGLKLTENDLLDLIYGQEKLHDTFCRNRLKTSIGFYPLKNIVWPLHYKAEKPEAIKFRPLEFAYEMNALEILERHPTGQKYEWILRGKDLFPVFLDDEGHILSLPPIINSEDYGKVTVEDSEILVEVTGIHKPTMDKVHTILAYALDMLGGEIYEVEVIYDDRKEIYPKTAFEEFKVPKKYMKSVLGFWIDDSKIGELLNKMGLALKDIDKDNITVLVPPYRADILHEIDIIDDVARAYTFDKIEPELTPVFTIGSYLSKHRVIDFLRDIMIGLGYIEAFTFALTSTEDQYTKMRLNISEKSVIIGGAKEKKINTVRTWLLPELLKTLSFNKEKKKPLKLFEISDVVVLDKDMEAGARNEIHMAAVSMHLDANFTEMRMALETVLDRLEVEYSFSRGNHRSFIEGRVASLEVNGEEVGFVGEIHPEVILNWGLNMPVAAFEINLDKIFKWENPEVEIS